MNDRYLFKAKKKNWQELSKDEQWVTGTIMYIENKCMMLIEDEENLLRVHYLDDEMWSAEIYAIEVDEFTICQCTGLKDKNDNLIWENDICNYYNSEDKDGIGIIKSDYVLWIDGTISMRHKMTPLFYLQCKNEWKVIGNIFDNSDLLKISESNL